MSSANPCPRCAGSGIILCARRKTPCTGAHDCGCYKRGKFPKCPECKGSGECTSVQINPDKAR